MRILVTRPLPEGERTATALRERGHEVLLAPLMQVKPVAADVSGRWSAVIVTSANAVRALPPAQIKPLLPLPVFAVGERSAAAARAAGFREVHSPQGNAADLVRLIAERYGGQAEPYLYLAGADRAADVEGDLKAKGLIARTVIVYRNVTVGFPPALFAAIAAGELDAVLHFSRRSAETFLSGAKDAGLSGRALSLRQLCISQNVAEPLVQAGAVHVDVASRPDEASVLALAAKRSS